MLLYDLIWFYLSRNSLSNCILSFSLKLSPQSLALHWSDKHVFWGNLHFISIIKYNIFYNINRASQEPQISLYTTSSHVLEANGSTEASLVRYCEDVAALVLSMRDEWSALSMRSGFSSNRIAAISDRSFSDWYMAAEVTLHGAKKKE